MWRKYFHNRLLLLLIFGLLIVGLLLLTKGLEGWVATSSNDSMTIIKQFPDQKLYRVEQVVDGDTIRVAMDGKVETVRLLGINTPETVDRRRPIECFGKEASDETKKLLTGKLVILESDATDRDKYDRLLRFVYLPLADGTKLFVDDYLVRYGFAQVLIIPPDGKYATEFYQAQQFARSKRLGMWGRC